MRTGETMRAAVMRDKKLVVADMPIPRPGPGEVLVKTLACGICGSDLHALKHAERFAQGFRRADGSGELATALREVRGDDRPHAVEA